MSVIQGNAIESGLAAYEIPNSLKFNSADSAYLSWTPASAGNRRTWTFSAWVKRSSTGARQFLFSTGTSGSNYGHFMIDSDDKLYYVQEATTLYRIGSSQLLRDFGAWYHIVFTMDTTNATSNDRMRYYVNGVRTDVGVFNTQPPQNTDMIFNQAAAHSIGRNHYAASDYAGYYLTEVNFIDGQALDPTSFGEYNTDTGVWQPKAYTGSYGTNGFYLPMTQDQIVEGFNTVLWRGNGGTQRITGVGFSPDLVWIKDRSNARNHYLYDSVRGALKELYSNLTSAESTNTIGLSSFGSDGFTLNNGDNAWNGSGNNYVAWCWDVGNSTVTNNDGTITGAQVRASQTYGFSVVTWTGAGSTGTVGHSLGATPKLIIAKRRNSTTNWQVYHSALTASNQVCLNLSNGSFGTTTWNSTEPTSSVFSVDNVELGASGGTYVAYCFAETGYSKFGTYSGTGTSGNTVTLGFKPAFVMIKRTDSAGDWNIRDNTRSPVNPVGDALYPNLSFAEYDGTETYINMTDTGFELVGNWASSNASGATYIYAAFKDQREAAFWRDFSGNGNHWQPNNLDFNDSVVDVPTLYGTDTGVGGEVRGNYATLNPLLSAGGTTSNGNLQVTTTAGVGHSRATIAIPNSGKWYAEFTAISASTSTDYIFGIVGSETAEASYGYNQTPSYSYTAFGERIVNGSFTSSFYSSFTTGDIIGCAVDLDTNQLTWYKNGTAQTAISITNGSYFWIVSDASGTRQVTAGANFGQLPFAYTAPSGFKALCTQNLPEPTVKDGGEYFNPVLYTGDGSASRNITGVGFQPDMVWIKSRSAATDHRLADAVRGGGKILQTNLTDAEASGSSPSAFLSDGFTVLNGAGVDAATNVNGATYVAWNWKANGTGVTNTAGTITSTVSANTTAGFSIVTYTSTTGTVGHGLGVAPAMIIMKGRNVSDQWTVGHKDLNGGSSPWNYGLPLNSTASLQTNSGFWNNTAPTSTVFSQGSWDSGYTKVAYCFAPVAGYSAFGSYVGNGSDDGPFVYTGFRPRYLMWKNATTAGNGWIIWDTARNPYNLSKTILAADQSIADYDATSVSPGFPCDILSNGFKLRGSRDTGNNSGATFIYAAFAENPFKYSLAR